MKNNMLKMNYHSTYYFCDLINDLVIKLTTAGLDYLEYRNTVNEFFEFEALYTKFDKYSILHRFIYYVIDRVFIHEQDAKTWNQVNSENYTDFKFGVNRIMDDHEIKHLSFGQWFNNNNLNRHYEEACEDAVSAYYEYLYVNPLHSLLSRITEEVFYILFQNRLFLKMFNEYVSAYISMMDLESLGDGEKEFFESDGILKRQYINTWVKKAVYFRDRGHCVCCNRDLTGIMSLIDLEPEIDHIVPLAAGGANDISNLQLLCKPCNLNKTDNSITYNLYQLWYEKDKGQ